MIEGERSATIEAEPERVWAIVSDIESYVDWHPFFASVDVLERDGDGRALSAACTHGTPVGTLTTEMAISYRSTDGVTAERTGGDLRAMHGIFDLEERGGATIVTHRLLVDPGARLGLLLRGSVEEKVRNSVLNGALTGLDGAVTGG